MKSICRSLVIGIFAVIFPWQHVGAQAPLATPAFISTKTEQIQLFDVGLTVNIDGTIYVRERIVYDFGQEQRHGIYRTIPTIKENNEGEKFVLAIRAEDV